MRGLAVLTLLAAMALPAHADTVSCNGKRGWQREIVLDSIWSWFAQAPRPEALIELVQAEHGIVACASHRSRPLRLHTTTLPRGLEPERLGALLLSNELEWGGLVARPEQGLAGELFRVRGAAALSGPKGAREPRR